MTDNELKTANAIRERIDTLDVETYALMDCIGKRINPFKAFKIRSCVRHNNISEEVTIKLTKQDILALQAIRSAEKDQLRNLLEDL